MSIGSSKGLPAACDGKIKVAEALRVEGLYSEALAQSGVGECLKHADLGLAVHPVHLVADGGRADTGRTAETGGVQGDGDVERAGGGSAHRVGVLERCMHEPGSSEVRAGDRIASVQSTNSVGEDLGVTRDGRVANGISGHRNPVRRIKTCLVAARTIAAIGNGACIPLELHPHLRTRRHADRRALDTDRQLMQAAIREPKTTQREIVICQLQCFALFRYASCEMYSNAYGIGKTEKNSKPARG